MDYVREVMYLRLRVIKLAALFVLFSGLVFAGSNVAAQAAPKYVQVPDTVLSKHQLKRSLFKLNDLYIFFSGPDGPFVRADSELILPVKAFTDIFNAKIDRDKNGKVYLSWPLGPKAGGRVIYTPNDATALYKGKPIKTGFKPTYLYRSKTLGNTLYVSAKPVLQALGLKLSYDQTLNMMHATGQEIYSSLTTAIHYMPHPYKPTTKLIPRSFYMTATWNIEVILAQRPGVNVAQGHQGLFTLVETLNPKVYTLGGPGAFPELDGVPASTDPCVKQKHIFVCDDSYTNSVVSVIVARVGVKP